MSTAILFVLFISGAVSEFPPYCTDTFPSDAELIKYKLINESLLIPELIRKLPEQILKVTSTASTFICLKQNNLSL